MEEIGPGKESKGMFKQQPKMRELLSPKGVSVGRDGR